MMREALVRGPPAPQIFCRQAPVHGAGVLLDRVKTILMHRSCTGLHLLDPHKKKTVKRSTLPKVQDVQSMHVSVLCVKQ